MIRFGWPKDWKYKWRSRHVESFCGIFRNLPHVMPGRWGFYFGAFEFGSRNPQNRIGVWLKSHGMWPW